jgi:hypothetical protein
MGWDKRLRLATSAAVMLGLAACGGSHQGAAGSQNAGAPAAAGPKDPNNLLIGSWKFSGIGTDATAAPGGCATAVTFTPTQQTMTDLSGTSSHAVTYNASPKGVYVMSDAGIAAHTTYIVLDPNHVQLDSWPACTFTRVG